MAVADDTAASRSSGRAVGADPQAGCASERAARRGSRSAASAAPRLRRARRLPPLLRRPARHRRDAAQGRPRRRPDGGAVGRRQPALRPGLRPLDPVQHHHRCRRRLPRLLRRRGQRPVPEPVRRAGAVRRSGRVRRRHRLADATVRHQRPALGPDRRRRPRPRDVPARARRASSWPASRWRCSGSSASGSSRRTRSTSRRDPLIDWTKLWVCVGVGVALFGLIGLWRYGPARLPRCRSSPAPAWAGSSGAWGGGDVGGGNFLGVAYATVVPAAILGARFGLATEPDAQQATAHRTARPRRGSS